MAKTGPPGPTGAVIAKWVTSSQVIGVLAAPHAGRLNTGERSVHWSSVRSLGYDMPGTAPPVTARQ